MVCKSEHCVNIVLYVTAIRYPRKCNFVVIYCLTLIAIYFAKQLQLNIWEIAIYDMRYCNWMFELESIAFNFVGIFK